MTEVFFAKMFLDEKFILSVVEENLIANTVLRKLFGIKRLFLFSFRFNTSRLASLIITIL